MAFLPAKIVLKEGIYLMINWHKNNIKWGGGIMTWPELSPIYFKNSDMYPDSCEWSAPLFVLLNQKSISHLIYLLDTGFWTLLCKFSGYQEVFPIVCTNGREKPSDLVWLSQGLKEVRKLLDNNIRGWVLQSNLFY